MRAVKRLVLLALLIATAFVAAMTWQAASRDEDYRALMGRGDEALLAEQSFGAIEAYSGAIALRPDSMLARLRRGETYQRRGELEAAARDFQAAAVLDAAAPRPLEELGDVRYAQRRFQRAADIYEQYLRLDDRAARVGYKLALARYREGNLSAALAAVDAALRIDERMADARYLQALCLRDQHRIEEARRALDQAVALAPGFIAAREELADLDRSLGRHRDELEQLQVLAGLDRDRIERHIAIGLAHARWSSDVQETPSKRAAQADLAVLTLGNALERAPDQPLIYSALGRVWLDIAQVRDDPVALNKALEALERVGSSNAATSESLTLYGRALLRAGRVDQAERTLQQATERYPADPSAFLVHASIAEQQNHSAAARESLIRYGALVSDAQGFSDRASRISALSLKLGDTTTAIEWVRRGLEKDPTHAALLAIQRQLR
jgi:tetratricopeptide (TPR) repeat protein